jgi:hypothetical protein
MKSAVAVFTLASLITGAVTTAPCAHAQTAVASSEVPLVSPPRATHLIGYACLAAGAGLIAGSFALSRHADRVYDDYLRATAPAEISRLYDETAHYDHLASGSLIGGEVAIAVGLYFRFLRRPAVSRLHLSLGPERCAVALRF